MACSHCLETNTSCGAKHTEDDHKALESSLWAGLNVSWEVIESCYTMGDDLGRGSYARVIEVPLRLPNSLLNR